MHCPALRYEQPKRDGHLLNMLLLLCCRLLCRRWLLVWVLCVEHGLELGRALASACTEPLLKPQKLLLQPLEPLLAHPVACSLQPIACSLQPLEPLLAHSKAGCGAHQRGLDSRAAELVRLLEPRVLPRVCPCVEERSACRWAGTAQSVPPAGCIRPLLLPLQLPHVELGAGRVFEL